MRIYNFLSNLSQFTGGVQKVMLDINEALKQFDIFTMSRTKYDDLCKDFYVSKDRYIRFSPFNIKNLNNSIIILHERRMVVLFAIIRMLCRLHFKIIYIHHSEMLSYRNIPFPADSIVAISDAGIRNLINDLNINKALVHKIHNCVRPINKQIDHHIYNKTGKIKLLLPAKIYDVKQQVEIVRHLKNRISTEIEIDFAGDGEDVESLKDEIQGYQNFKYLGFVKDVINIIPNYDYVLLFSKHEGLPISLIEAAMIGCPIVSNSIGGCSEIVEDGINGYIADNWDELIQTINNLPQVSSDQWEEMSKNSKKIYSEKFTFDRFKQKYINLINSL